MTLGVSGPDGKQFPDEVSYLSDQLAELTTRFPNKKIDPEYESKMDEYLKGKAEQDYQRNVIEPPGNPKEFDQYIKHWDFWKEEYKKPEYKGFWDQLRNPQDEDFKLSPKQLREKYGPKSEDETPIKLAMEFKDKGTQMIGGRVRGGEGGAGGPTQMRNPSNKNEDLQIKDPAGDAMIDAALKRLGEEAKIRQQIQRQQIKKDMRKPVDENFTPTELQQEGQRLDKIQRVIDNIKEGKPNTATDKAVDDMLEYLIKKQHRSPEPPPARTPAQEARTAAWYKFMERQDVRNEFPGPLSPSDYNKLLNWFNSIHPE